MRKILFLVLCSMILDLCYAGSPMLSKLNPTEPTAKRIAFLMREACKETGSGNELVEANVPIRSLSARSLCSDTIGFMPITKDKVQVFVTADKITGFDKIELSYTEPDPNDINAKVTSIVMSCDETGKLEVPTGNNKTPLTVTKTDDILFLEGATTTTNIVQCKSIFIESVKDKKTLADIFKINVEWNLAVTASGATKIYTGKSFDIFGKLHCEPDVIITNLDDGDENYVDRKIEKLELEAGAVDQYVHKNKFGEFFTHTRVSNQCPDADALMTYSVVDKAADEFVKEKGDGAADYVECVRSEKDGQVTWKYVIAPHTTGPPPTTQTPDQVVPPRTDLIDLAHGKKIKVKCMRYKCRDCKLPDPAVDKQFTCPSDTGCDYVNPTPSIDVRDLTFETFSKCPGLLTNSPTCKVLFVNNNAPIKFTPKISYCGSDGQFNFDKEERVKVTTIRCAQQFSAQKHQWYTTDVPPTMKNVTETKEVEKCDETEGCKCSAHVVNGVVLDQLALANKNNSGWIRIKSAKFNFDDNTWSYFRKHADGAVKEHELNTTRVLRCIANPNDVLKLRGVKETLLPNPKKTMVVVANLGVLALFVGITVPGVILFVNAREKKREARKAAKKDKKKDEQSGDKKDSDGKKDEKKNEA